jgi:hypothetical protein
MEAHLMADEYAPGSFDLGYDSVTGTMTKMHITPDQKLIFEDVVNIEGIAEQNKAIRNEISNTERLPDGMVKVASLPMLVYLELQQKGILKDKMAFRKWLRSDAAAPYRNHRITS